ncbi:ParB N-terminal domain-containing protein [Fodinicola acaciae]|uniref:ParB N-terminal domain-containing protein n=1 Tax=Fodinicola acaciae TaxID=2681555 RepID=UPI0013D748F1|nr:ParB N-terminal domain-containing protein [Fodinicola acaciae]
MKSLPRRALNAAKFRGRKVALRSRTTALALADRATSAARRNVPEPIRLRLSRTFLRPAQPARVSIDKLLLGAQGGLSATDFARVTGNPLWPSTRVADGPHVALLQAGAVTDDDILASRYGQLGLACLRATGGFFWADSPAGVVEVARDFLARRRSTGGYEPRANQSGTDDPILVEKIRDSDCYSVLDGHHRIALAYAAGETAVSVVVKRTSTSTPLQELLRRMSWLEGSTELYQPVDFPELKSWTLVRQCTDRLDKMQKFLDTRRIFGSYLDVASCYGWFVERMSAVGFVAEGIEKDPLAVPLGTAIYRLQPGMVHSGQCEEFLRGGRVWDVVSCFSLLHHFVLGRGSVSAEELVKLLDAATGSVLFLDMGQEHEDWFGTSLAGWDAERIRAFLAEHGTFDEIVDLGPDSDGVGAYAGNYGRHLFACVRQAVSR